MHRYFSYDFVSLCDGTGFVYARKKDCLPDKDDYRIGVGPITALYCVGFHEHNANVTRSARLSLFRVKLIKRGPLLKINRLAQILDAKLSHTIRQYPPALNNNTSNVSSGIKAIISLSLESTTIHSALLDAYNQVKYV